MLPDNYIMILLQDGLFSLLPEAKQYINGVVCLSSITMKVCEVCEVCAV